MKSVQKLEYLLLLVVGPRDLNYLSTRLLKTKSDKLERLSKLLHDLETRVGQSIDTESVRRLTFIGIRAFKNYTRIFLLIYGTMKLLSKKVALPKSDHTDLRLANSIGLLLSMNPILREVMRIVSGSKYNKSLLISSILPNVVTCALSFVKYPNHPLLQKHYLSIYSFVLLLEHGFKLLENLTLVDLRRFRISKDSHLKNKSWILFPICYAKIFKYFILENDSCPKYFLRSLDYLSRGLFSSDEYSVPTLIKYKDSINLADVSPLSFHGFINGYVLRRSTLLFKIVFPVMLFYNHKSFDTPIDIVNASLKESFKAIASLLFLVSSSVYSSYFIMDKRFQERYMPLFIAKLPKSIKLQLIGFITGLITFFYKSKGLTMSETNSTYRSIWLYIFRLTLISSTAKHSNNHRSKFNAYRLDKVLMTLSLSGLLTIGDIYHRQRTDISQTSLNNQTSLKLLLKYINSGNLLAS